MFFVVRITAAIRMTVVQTILVISTTIMRITPAISQIIMWIALAFLFFWFFHEGTFTQGILCEYEWEIIGISEQDALTKITYLLAQLSWYLWSSLTTIMSFLCLFNCRLIYWFLVFNAVLAVSSELLCQLEPFLAQFIFRCRGFKI